MTEFVDIFDLSRRGAEIEGEALVRDLPGLTAFTATDAGRLAFSARGMGERRGLPAARLSMEGDVEMFCARCNKPVPVHIASEAVFRFAESEEAANALPIEEDEEDERGTCSFFSEEKKEPKKSRLCLSSDMLS